MADPSKPWMKFYPQDWRADEKLRMCSLAARGLWIEMLAIMHRSERYGQLLVNGRVPTDAQLAVQVGASPSEVTAMLAELDGAGVFSRSANRAIYSRRMTRDHKKAKTARENGKNGGNPSLGKGRGNPASDNPTVKGGLKGGDKPQKPEARSQRLEKEPDGSLPPNPPDRFRLPEWVPEAEWVGFCEMRRRIKAPLTDRAKGGILRELEKLRDDGHPPGRVLDQSTTHSWRGIFPLKDGTDDRQLGRHNGASHPLYRRDPAWDRFKELRDEFVADPEGFRAETYEGG